MSVRDVKSAFQRVTTDRKIDASDVDTILSSAGSISKDEQAAIKAEADKFAGMMEPAAKRKLQEKLGELDSLRRQAESANREVTVSSFFASALSFVACAVAPRRRASAARGSPTR